MTVTYAHTNFSFTSGSTTAPTPTGTGGALVVAGFWRDVGLTPNTPGDWQLIASQTTWGECKVTAYISRSATPDMVFLRASNDERSLHVWRIDDADPVAAAYSGIGWSSGGFDGTTQFLGDLVASAPDGVYIGMIGTSSGGAAATLVSTSLGHTIDGNFGTPSFWIGPNAGVHSIVTPGGATYDAGTMTHTSNQLHNVVNVVVETASGPPPTDPGPVHLIHAGRRYRRALAAL